MRIRQESELERVRMSMRQSRNRAGQEIAKREHTLFAVAASAALGIAEAKGHKLPRVFDVDGTIVFGTLALMGATHMGGKNATFLQSLADGWLAIGSYKMGLKVGGANSLALEGLGEAHSMDALLSAV